MSKQLVCQKFIFKIHSSRLRAAKWNLSLTLSEARKNDEMIALADSQVLRWIDEINGVDGADERAKDIKREIRMLRREDDSYAGRKRIRELYAELDAIQFKPDYMSLIIDKTKDYYRACEGFTINGVEYRRLLGTNGGIKMSTIVFVSADKVDELRRRIDNGRNLEKKFVPAKLEAYRALSCSASVPVSYPNGIIVVDDAYTKFKDTVLTLTDECDGEPVMKLEQDYEVELDATDGFGLMLPALAERWSEELNLGYTMSGCNTRLSFEKGMIFAFDFIEFAEEVAHTYIIKDAWGDERDVRNAELIFTTSMLKLWDSYDSCEDYLRNCLENNYTIGVTKTTPRELENERHLNYQFIQSYDLDDDDIEELIRPTMDEIRDVIGGDWRKMVLFTKGIGLNDQNVASLEDDYIKAVMIDERAVDDPFIQKTVYRLIKNRINEAKIGVIKVHGNFSIILGDPYALCQSMFGLEVTGLLKRGELYNEYWANTDVDEVVCFRAPMSCHNNIPKMVPAKSDDKRHWYRYINTATILNAWDENTAAMNGCDFDGDIIMITDNPVLVRKHRDTPVLVCAQRNATKMVPTEEDFIAANIASFGNDIGKTTNWITTMFDIQARYDKDSEEYKVLDYRIQCGQLYQQNKRASA